MKEFLTLIVVCLNVLTFAAREKVSTSTDSLMCETTFVIRGRIAKQYEDKIKFAVTDPVKNKSYNISAPEGKFLMTVPMRGRLQNIYLYIDGTVMIPVCPGDTVNLTIDDDDMMLSSDNPHTDSDLRLSLALHRKTIRQYRAIEALVNRHHRLSDRLTRATTSSDSLLSLIISESMKYQARYREVIDTFIRHNGNVRNEEFFRIHGYFSPIRLIAWHPQLTQLFTPQYFSDRIPQGDVTTYCDRFLDYPVYRMFVRDYTYMSVDRAFATFAVSDPDGFERKSRLRREISPTTLLADWLDIKELQTLMSSTSPDRYDRYVRYVYDTVRTPSLKSWLAGLVPDVARLGAGQPAPPLSFCDTQGNTLTLDSLRGTYLLLDFWDFGCAPCIREFAVMPLFKEHYSGRLDNIRFITVCCSRSAPGRLEKFILEHHLDDTNLILDKKNSDPCYNSLPFPTYLLIDPEGKIVEFNTDRPSFILKKSLAGQETTFDKILPPSP